MTGTGFARHTETMVRFARKDSQSSRRAGFALACLLVFVGGAGAQTSFPPLNFPSATPRTPGGSTNPNPASNLPLPVEAGQGMVSVSVVYAASDTQPLRSGVTWRIYKERGDADGKNVLVKESKDPSPVLNLPDGDYIVHAAVGLAGVTKRVSVNGKASAERLVLNAGGLRVNGMLGDNPIVGSKLSVSIYVPERGNSEAKLVLANAKASDLICLPEGNYHIVTSLVDTSGGSVSGSSNVTNSVVAADVRVQPGKLTEANLRHKAAVMTLKLVSAPGAEALANTSFSILTPGGDVIRELIGAFPALVLAEGEYVAIARHNGATYQTNFRVTSTLDRDVEIIAQKEPK